MKKGLHIALIVAALLASMSALALAVDYALTKQVFSNGATNSSGGDYELRGSLGQTAIGAPYASPTILHEGFWASEQPDDPCCYFISGNGDYDPNDQCDITDLVYMVDFMFNSGPTPPCFEEADVDGSEAVDIGDLVYLNEYQNLGGPAPVDCP